MNNRERENATLSFDKNLDRGSVEETFYPWSLTFERWKNEGHLPGVPDNIFDESNGKATKEEHYLNCLMTNGVYKFEQSLGFDGVKRVSMEIPFKDYGKYPLTCAEDWKLHKDYAMGEIDLYFTDENIEKIYGRFREGHQRGDYSIRFSVQGFFWIPRELFGIEKHLYAFYDCPEIMHDINEFVLDVYMQKLDKVFDIIPADVLYILEDLSGKNGPMLSPVLFDEFVGNYYKRLVPFLKGKGVKNVFIDTDGDFEKLIPNFMDAGIDGFLPMDVNAGMDIVKVRRKYPGVKFIGGFNKLAIAEGRDAIDREFERIYPVIRQGGYIPGCDHQVAPSTSFENYMYYIKRLKEVMLDACKEGK